MAKRRVKKIAKTTDVVARLRKALAKCAKAELIDMLAESAAEDRNLLGRLEARFEMQVSPEEIAAATRQAIDAATAFDERDSNRNFSFDYKAYGEVRRNLSRLIGLGELRAARKSVV